MALFAMGDVLELEVIFGGIANPSLRVQPQIVSCLTA
jgi:hypothetical protein